jgi:hypothetical protein
MIELREQFWAIEVPSMAFGFDVNNYGDESEFMYMLSMEDIADDDNTEETLITNPLPPGTWQIICTSKDTTEELLKEVIPELPVGQRWQNYGGDYPVWFHSRRESLRSLLASKVCDVDKTYLILKND